jgi:tetratricopeptide (TPR) repeat protein
MRKRRFGQALAACHHWEATWGQSAELIWIKASANMEIGEFSEAEQLLRRHLKLDPHNAAGVRRLAQLLRTLGRSGEAKQLLENFVARHGSGEVLGELAQNCLEAGNSDLAILYAHQALEENSESFQALMVLGSAFVLLGAADQALRYLEFARRLAPSDPQVHINMAAAHELLGNSSERIASLERALLCEEGLLPVRKLLAGLYLEAGDIAGARSQLEAMLALGDDSFATKFGLARAQRELGECRRAVEILLELLGEHGEELPLWVELASCYIQLKDSARADKVIEQILLMDPDNPEALSMRGHNESAP